MNDDADDDLHNDEVFLRRVLLAWRQEHAALQRLLRCGPPCNPAQLRRDEDRAAELAAAILAVELHLAGPVH